MSLDGLILPNYMLVKRNFVCSRCAFRFFKQTPSRVEKCPKCTYIVYELGYKQGETLDPYSKSKERWYSEESGKKHRDEIRNRKIVEINGQKIIANTDGKGHTIDYIPTFSAKNTDMGTKKAQGELK